MESKIYNQSGKETGSFKLPERIFGLPWNESLVHQVVVAMMGNARIPWAHTKNRGEVAGTGMKPWKQKGTGRARHGSRRSPIWVGGGITHGPRNEKSYDRKINRKMRVKALFTVLSKKIKDGEIMFIDSIAPKEAKTKLAKDIFKNLAGIKDFKGLQKKNNAAFLALGEKNEKTIKSFRNFNNIEVGNIKDINPVDLLKYKYLIIDSPEASVKVLEARAK